jgi:hypothetical protein
LGRESSLLVLMNVDQEAEKEMFCQIGRLKATGAKELWPSSGSGIQSSTPHSSSQQLHQYTSRLGGHVLSTTSTQAMGKPISDKYKCRCIVVSIRPVRI